MILTYPDNFKDNLKNLKEPFRNKTVPGKVATTCIQDGQKQNTKTSTTI